MRRIFILACMTLLFSPLVAVAQSGGNPDDMFSGDTVEGAQTPDQAAPAQGPSVPAAPAQAAPGPQTLLQSRGVEVGGFLFSNYTTSAYWAGGYPSFPDPGAGVSSSFVPNLEADLFVDARPYPYFRVFSKFRIVYPFGGMGQGVSQAQIQPFASVYAAPQTAGGAAAASLIPNISVFELFVDMNDDQRIFLRMGQQVIHWGVGYFFSPADIISLTPINPLQPALERQGPLALSVNVPFAAVDNAYFYVIANQAFAQNGAFSPSDLAVASKVEFLVGDYEIGVGGYYQKDQGPKAMLTATGSLFGKIGIFGEGVLSYGADRVLVQPAAGSPGLYQSFTDTSTPYFSGTVGASYAESSQHISACVQYFFNGQGYADLTAERGAVDLYGSQQAARAGGFQPPGPLLVSSDLFLPGRHYLAASLSWNDIRASNFDVGLFYEGNFSDGSGVASIFAAYTPMQYVTVTVAPSIGYGEPGSEFVSKFGYLALSLKLTVGEGAF